MVKNPIMKKKGKERLEERSNSIASLLGFKEIRDGILVTEQGYFLFLEIMPSNIALKSDIEQRYNIVQFESFLKVIQNTFYIFTIAKRGDAKEQVDEMKELLLKEENESVREYMTEYMRFIADVTYENSSKIRFILAIPFVNPMNPNKGYDENTSFSEVKSILYQKELLAREHLSRAGNEVVTPQNKNGFIAQILFELFNVKLSEKQNIEEVMNYD